MQEALRSTVLNFILSRFSSCMSAVLEVLVLDPVYGLTSVELAKHLSAFNAAVSDLGFTITT